MDCCVFFQIIKNLNLNMALAHNHSHHTHGAHSHAKASINLLMIAIAIILGFAVIEAFSGWRANSMALLSDAGHMAADGLTLFLAAIAGWIANKPPSSKHSYGLGRAEVLGAWISSLLIVVVAIFIGVEAIARLKNPEPVASHTVIIIASLGVIINLFVAWLLSHAEQTLNLRAAILHVIGDLLGSVAAVVSGIVIYLTGWLPIDAILSLFIMLLILISSFRLLKETLLVLMEGVPLHLSLAEVGKAMAGIEKVVAVHDLHIWTLSSGQIVLTAHIQLNEMHDWQVILTKLRHLLTEQFAITHVTLQPETHVQVIPINANLPKRTLS